ncbi:MAG: hypothetical protein JO142_13410 [Burkholderiales bacterium]|nr:hypothetical protein [Burkholderiales bacterium]
MDYDDMGLAPPNLASNEIDMLFEEGKMFAEVTMHGEDSGLPLLRKYLPEIYDGQILQAMANDPWLDRDLLGDAIRSGHFSTIYEDRWSTHPRWLPEWRSYCGAPTI